MGTVGLSFGSPTSGTGFDVSSTVAEIVSNLQNVETPWKTQLSSLESQDTVISSLGTLFSNLSNDISSLTDFQGVLAQKEGSSSDTSVLELTGASSSATAGTHTVVVKNLAQTASGYIDAVTNASDVLSGSLSIQLGSGTTENIVIGAAPSSPAANTIYTGSGVNTLAGITTAINNAGLGVTANVLADANGSRLSLVSNTSGSAGQITVTSSLTDPNAVTSTNTTGALNYNATTTGLNASLVIDGVPLSSTSNTVTNLIPGVTFQLLAPSAAESDNTLESVQVVISNDNSGVESTVNQFVTDYNSLISAVNTQEGNTSSGTPEPLYGSPTIALLQQELLSGLNAQSPNGYFTSVSSAAGTTVTGAMTITTGNGQAETVEVGAAPSTPAANTIYTGSGADYNTLAGVAAAINAADTDTVVGYTASADSTSGTITANSSAQLSGTLTITTDTGSTETIYLGTSADALTGDLATGTSDNTLSSLESFISSNAATLGVSNVSITSNGDGTSTLSLASSDGNALTVASNVAILGLGITAAVVTSNGESTFTLTSQTAQTSGSLSVTSSLVASTPTPLGYTDAGYTSSTQDSGSLDAVSASTDTLSGSFTFQPGNGTTETVVIGAAPSSPAANTIYTGAGADTLSDVVNTINNAGLGVNAAVDSTGTVLTLTSSTTGAAGALTVTSSLLDTANPTTTALNYNTSSDINNLTSLGISVNNDGSLTFDADNLDSILNSDYSGVAGFFQNSTGWGQNFSTLLDNAGNSSPTGILALAQSSNSNTESTLNAEISKEQTYISAQQSSLTTELNSANEVLQQLPTELNGVNELYAAISGYNENSNG